MVERPHFAEGRAPVSPESTSDTNLESSRGDLSLPQTNSADGKPKRLKDVSQASPAKKAHARKPFIQVDVFQFRLEMQKQTHPLQNATRRVRKASRNGLGALCGMVNIHLNCN